MEIASANHSCVCKFTLSRHSNAKHTGELVTGHMAVKLEIALRASALLALIIATATKQAETPAPLAPAFSACRGRALITGRPGGATSAIGSRLSTIRVTSMSGG